MFFAAPSGIAAPFGRAAPGNSSKGAALSAASILHCVGVLRFRDISLKLGVSCTQITPEENDALMATGLIHLSIFQAEDNTVVLLYFVQIPVVTHNMG